MSNPARLALQRQSDKSFTQVGKVIDEVGSDVAVLTATGAEQRLPRKSVIQVTVGSLPHFERLHPEALATALADSPLRVFEQALIDSPKALKVADLKRRLGQTLPAHDVDSAWKKVKKSLDDHPDVRVSKTGNANTYAWKGDSISRLASYLPVEAVAEASAPIPSGTREDRANEVPPAPVDTPPPPESSVAPVGDNTTSGTPASSPAAKDAENAAPQPVRLIDLLNALIPAEAGAPLRDHDDLVENLLAVGEALAKLPAQQVRTLSRVDEDDRPLLLLLLCAANAGAPRWAASWGAPSAQSVGASLEQARQERSRHPALGDAFARFAAGTLSLVDVSSVPLSSVARAFVQSVNSAKAEGRHKEAVATALAERAETAVTGEWDEARGLLDDIAQAMAQLPLAADGPRGRFLAALYALRRDLLVADDRLWTGVDLPMLSDAADGPLRQALLDEEVETSVVRPTIQRFIDRCSTRSDVATLIALRGAFARHVAPADVVRAMRNASQRDPHLSAWLTELRQESRIDSLIAERDDARMADERAQRATTEKDAELESTVRQLEETRRLLYRAREANEQSREADLRQAKLDVLKSLAALAAAVHESPSAREDAALQQRVRFALSREGLDQIANAGETARYDPAVHDAQGAVIEVGASVSVGRPGYIYSDSGEPMVLLKAHVAKQ